MVERARVSQETTVHYWATFSPEAVTLAVDDARHRFGEGLEVVDLSSLDWEPWAPLPQVAAAPRPKALRAYFRHAHLLEGREEVPVEPMIDEELAYERGRLADSLLDRVRGAADQPRVLLVRHAERLSAETFFVAERLREHPRSGLVLVFCFEASPVDRDRFDRLDSLGYIVWLGPPLSASTAVPPLPPTADQRRQLLRWMCFETLALATGDEAAPDRLQALSGWGAFEEGIELGEALVRRLGARSDASVLRRVRIALARLYRQAGDPASAARSLTLGWKLARDGGDAADTADAAEIDFLLFETSYRALVIEDVYLGLEDRLVDALTSLGWENHLAYVMTKNVWVQTVGRTKGWTQAHELWERGRAFARRLGNHRRLAVALQTQGSLLAIEGKLPEALAATRRGVVLARQHSSPLHAAKVENGLGFLEFTAGHYRLARDHHVKALELLPETRDLPEYIGTLVNLGRLFLFNDQADRALPLLTTAIRAMDGLGLSDLPFHPRSNTYALQGVCCLKTGQPSRALEFLRKLREDEVRTGRVNEHRLCLEVLVAEARGDSVQASAFLEQVVALLMGRLGDLRHLLMWVLFEAGLYRSQGGDAVGAEACWARAENILPAEPLGRDVRLRLQSLRSQGAKRIRPLPPVTWDSPLLVRFSKQEASLRQLRRAVQDYGFLQSWHQVLQPGLPAATLYEEAVTLVRSHFPIGSVAILEGTGPSVLALAPGSDGALIGEAAMRLPSTVGVPGATLVAVFPLTHSGETVARLVCVDSDPEPLFGESDRRVLELAADHLSILLLSGRKAQDLEERGTHLARALDVLRDTQERLVRSENLAVLGNLSASLAHELNTPLGAILSSSRTVHEVLSGPLVRLWDEAHEWGRADRELFRNLVDRLVTRDAPLSPVSRTDRRALRDRLRERGIEDADTQAELWFEVGLGDAADLQEAVGAQAGTSRVLERLVPIAQGQRLSRVIEEAATRAGAVVGTLRSYLQGSQQEGATDFLLTDELNSVLAVLGASRWRSVRVDWEIEAGLLITARRLPLAQVFTNLIQNAVQAMEGKGALTLRGFRQDGRVVIEVADTGPGIPEEFQDQILEPFFSTKKQTGGLGLGLDISRRIVEAHQGRLSFESRPGRTVFRVVLPQVQT